METRAIAAKAVAGRLLAALVFGLLIVFARPISANETEVKVRGAEIAEDFLAGRTDAIWDRMTPGMQAAIGNGDALEQLAKTVRKDFGATAKVVSEEVGRAGEHEVYRRISTSAASGLRLLTQVAFAPDGRIAGFEVRPEPVAAESRFLDYRTKADLRLPFEGTWTVYWGGRGIENNYHAADPAQRFATDFVVEKDGATHGGEGGDPAAYYCWDRPILSPADGRIVTAVGDRPDQPIGTTDTVHPAGNHVVIEFGAGEFGFLAHLRQGSLKVRSGDEVEAGQEIGRCGNSGNTSEPHLHFHLQTTSDLSAGEGLPAQFRGYIADGNPVARGEPVRGQKVTPARP